MSINEILRIIDDDSLGKNIVKYIAPYFTLNKEKTKLLEK